jgi:hypothetical protein
MSDEAEGGLVCGFGDLGSGLAVLAWNLAGGGSVLLGDGKASAAAPEFSPGADALRVDLRGEHPIDATLAPRRDPTPLTDAPADSPQASRCEAAVRSGGSERTPASSGHLISWSEDPLEGAGTFRHLAVELGDGSLLIASAWGEQRLEGHGNERVSAWLIDADGAMSGFEEALLSTQYDGDGHPTRAGLELWPADDAPPVRVAASSLGGAEVKGAWGGLFRCHSDGTEGLGGYLLWRR